MLGLLIFFHLKTQEAIVVLMWVNFYIAVLERVGSPEQRKIGNGQLMEQSEHTKHLLIKFAMIPGAPEQL